MSWKRCWNSGGFGHGLYESEDEQIVPDIDRRTSSSSSSSLASNSSSTSADTASSSSIRAAIDTHHQHHHQASSASSHANMHRPVSSSSASSYRNFSSKRDTFGSSSNNHSAANAGGRFGQHRANDAGHSSPTDDRYSHYRVFGLKTTVSPSNSSAPAPFSWSTNKSPRDSNEYYGSSRTTAKRSALELNDFWEEKYSQIAIITTTNTNHFGQPMVNKF